MGYCVVITTRGNREEAEKLAGLIVEDQLAACVHLSSIISYYTCDDQVNKDPEIKILIKTRTALYDELGKIGDEID